MKIVNVRGMPPNSPGIIYCGRDFGGWKKGLLCNLHSSQWPCRVIRCLTKRVRWPYGGYKRFGPRHTKEEAIAEFKKDLWKWIQEDRKEVVDFLKNLPDDAVLGCWCEEKDESQIVKGAPYCHCEIIVLASRWIKSL